MKEKVMFETNVPVPVALAQAEGTEVPGRCGDEVMYNLQDGRVMFVPLSIRDEVRKLEVKPGEPLQVCKREVEVLGEPCIEWTVSRKESSQGPKAVQVVQRKLEAAGLWLLAAAHCLTIPAGNSVVRAGKSSTSSTRAGSWFKAKTTLGFGPF